jgi:hypothetical protein
MRLIKQLMGILFGDSYCVLDGILRDRNKQHSGKGNEMSRDYY